MANTSGKIPFGWDRSTDSKPNETAKSSSSTPTRTYYDIVSGSPEIIVTGHPTFKEISLDSAFSGSVSDHENRITTLESDSGDGATALALEEIRTSSFVILADSNETITKAQGLRRFISTLTAHRTKTISKTGVIEGDTITIQRNSSDPYNLRIVDPDAGEIFCLSSIGRITVRLEGGDGSLGTWKIEDSYLINGSQKLNIKDFGAIGDGVTDDGLAIQAFFDALCDTDVTSGKSTRYGFIPAGKYLSSIPLRLYGNGTNVTSFILEGESNSNNSARGCEIVYTGADINNNAFLSFVGVSGSLMTGVIINANNKCKYTAWATLEDLPAGDESSQNTVINQCTFIGAKSLSGAAQFAVGPELGSIASGASDVSAWRWSNCLFVSSGLADGWKTLQANNVLDFHLTNCVFSGGNIAINNFPSVNSGSYPFRVDGCQITDASFWAIADCGYASIYTGCYGERNGGVLVGAAGHVVLDNCIMNIIGVDHSPHTADKGYGIIHPSCEIRGGQYSNYRQKRPITNVNTSTDTITVGPSPTTGHPLDTPLANGQLIWIYAADGADALPGCADLVSIRAGEPCYIRDLASLGSDTFSFKLANSLGGSALDINYAGTGTLYAHTQFSIAAAYIFKATDAVFDMAMGHLPVFSNGGFFPGNDALSSWDGPGLSTQNAIEIERCVGGTAGTGTLLKSIKAYSTCTSRISPTINLYPRLTPLRFMGVNLSGFSCIELTKDTFIRGNMPAFGAFTSYIHLPPRTRLNKIFVTVDQAFDLATASLNIQVATTGTAGDILASSSLLAPAVFGYVDTDLGSKMQRANAVQGGYAPDLNTWALQLNWSFTAAVPTTGIVRIYLELIRLELPNVISGGSTGAI